MPDSTRSVPLCLRRARMGGFFPRLTEVTPDEVPPDASSDEVLLSRLDALALRGRMTVDTEVDAQEADALLASVHAVLDVEHCGDLLDACCERALLSILGPFGLGRLLFADKDGGNVTTLHNANDGVFASEADADRFQRPYDPHAYHDGNAGYVEARERLRIRSDRGDLRDAYCPRRDISGHQFIVDRNGEARRQSRWATDHVVPAREVHDDPRVRLSMDEASSADMANASVNLQPTASGLNCSKKHLPLEEWMEGPSSHDPSVANAEAWEVARAAAGMAGARARRHIEVQIERGKVLYYVGGALGAGARVSVKLGFREAAGLVLCEVVTAAYGEIRDCWKAGFCAEGEDWWDGLARRLHRIGERVIARWKDAWAAFVEGCLSGFVSNLVTMLINVFTRTGKRMVRVLREGVLSLVRAVHMLLFPPPGMTPREAAHEASKVAAASLVVVGGICVEEAVDKAIKAAPWLEPLADILTTVLVGIATGLTTVLAVWALDKLDLFGVVADEHHRRVCEQLAAVRDQRLENAEVVAARISGLLGATVESPAVP